MRSVKQAVTLTIRQDHSGAAIVLVGEWRADGRVVKRRRMQLSNPEAFSIGLAEFDDIW